MNPPYPSLEAVAREIVECQACPRLVAYRQAVARRKTRRYQAEAYWGRPLPGFGDPAARLVVIGLAPAAHGGNRTGRMFTGDTSGDWLVRGLYRAGLANQPVSRARDDGLRLQEAFVTAPVRCAPPQNRPTPAEIETCSRFLAAELELLPRVVAVLTLGQVGFSVFFRLLAEAGWRFRKPPFRHGAVYRLVPSPAADGPLGPGRDRGPGTENWLTRRPPTLFVSYHPSRQNTQTGRLTEAMWFQVWDRIRAFLGGAPVGASTAVPMAFGTGVPA